MVVGGNLWLEFANRNSSGRYLQGIAAWISSGATFGPCSNRPSPRNVLGMSGIRIGCGKKVQRKW